MKGLTNWGIICNGRTDCSPHRCVLNSWFVIPRLPGSFLLNTGVQHGVNVCLFPEGQQGGCIVLPAPRRTRPLPPEMILLKNFFALDIWRIEWRSRLSPAAALLYIEGVQLPFLHFWELGFFVCCCYCFMAQTCLMYSHRMEEDICKFLTWERVFLHRSS